ncbi:putative methyltransferase [Cafeteria roenbergensis virus]|uniref:Putative methyltransferase n=1 Tax=Cafeteria roenbergensis virus (strain BV-PW1) TaxID=693272 RepID=E3T4K7_CROVB|nr:methyltransferase [Cafeteria roenbergensis virus BV-PW1]ADO67120.1 putative methyltransferase [Cafeteria roenbergensis virus BV-PW1]
MDKNLKEVYESIAEEFNHSRYKVWPCVENFLTQLPTQSKGLEIGCGNGKNMLFRTDLNMTGVDFCDNFIKMCTNKQLNVLKGDIRNLPFESNTFDFTISIAVLHHLYDMKDRIKAIEEQIRVTKENGKMMIVVWGLDQSESTQTRKFNTSDEMVSWKKKNGEILYRYYHLYKKDELKEEVLITKNIIIDNIFYENGNCGIILKKYSN